MSFLQIQNIHYGKFVLNFSYSRILYKIREFIITAPDYERMEKEIKNYEGKVIHCLNCPKPIQCRCLAFETDRGCYYFCSLDCYNKFNAKGEVDFDYEFGEYEGHYFFCELGGHFEEKWKELKKDRDGYKRLYEDFHAKHKKLKETSGADKKI